MNRTLRKIVTSTGAAMNIELGFVPNSVEVRNVTQWKQVSQNTNLFWNSNMADAAYYGYATQSTLTDGLLPVTDTSNGFTPYDTTNVVDRQKVLEAATAANPCVITVTGHGYTAANDGDTLSFNFIPSDSMHELSGNRYTMTYIGADSFSIDVDSTNFTTFDAATTRGGIVVNESVTYEDTGFKGITLGTIPAANSADVLELIVSFDELDMPTV